MLFAGRCVLRVADIVDFKSTCAVRCVLRVAVCLMLVVVVSVLFVVS